LPLIRAKVKREWVTCWFLAAIALGGLLYVCLSLTPSSYGFALQRLLGDDIRPLAGSSREIRSDEWAVSTPYIQAAVRNHFQRVNQTSFYREDLRVFYAMPIADWSLVFKPQVWAFWVTPPATAYSIYFAVLMCGFLAGYHLLFRHLGVPPWLAAAGAITLYSTGYVQFWWTTVGPLLAGLPWILLIVLQKMAWWKKALLCCWAFPTFVFSHTYPPTLLSMVWCGIFLVLVVRPALLRAPGELLAIGLGALVTGIALYLYFGDTISIVRNSVYPGHRIGKSGTLAPSLALSQIFPFLAFRLSDYMHYTATNICETGCVGSFLPLLTLCLLRYRSLRQHATVRKGVLILMAAFTAISLWQLVPVPAWIGHVLLWDTGEAQRWLYASGFLLTLVALLIWTADLISWHPLRITIFVLVGPIASLFLKIGWLMNKGELLDAAISESTADIVICGLGLLVCAAAWYIPTVARAPIVVIAVVLVNVYCFAGFNPLQSAKPIFQVPDSAVILGLQEEAAASPDGVLVHPGFFGAVLNGLGFRSVTHVLLMPRLAFFQPYFPYMNRERFNWVFNRYAHINLTQDPLPDVGHPDVVEVPMEVFVPVRNVRRLTLGLMHENACALPSAGGIDRLSLQGNELTIEGWAPWTAETDAQGIRLLSARPLRLGALSTITRPDIAEQLQDYHFVKSGFKLQISSVDGKPLRMDELVVIATGTSKGEARLTRCQN
jgi:hypothetical protein